MPGCTGSTCGIQACFGALPWRAGYTGLALGSVVTGAPQAARRAPGRALRLSLCRVGKFGSGQRGPRPLIADPLDDPKNHARPHVVDAFAVSPRCTGQPGLHVEGRPDEDKRDSADTDALADPFAIGHTSIHALLSRRRDSDWFMRDARSLGHEPGEYRRRLTCGCKGAVESEMCRRVDRVLWRPSGSQSPSWAQHPAGAALPPDTVAAALHRPSGWRPSGAIFAGSTAFGSTTHGGSFFDGSRAAPTRSA
jgi:hypothetical protein